MKLTLEVVEGEAAGEVLAVERGELCLGRDEDQDLVLPDWHVSSQHGKVGRTRKGWVYKDLFSTNGSRVVRGDKVIELDASGRLQSIIEDGDVLRLGDPEHEVVLTVRITDDAADADPGEIRAVRRLADVEALAEGVEADPRRLKALHGAARRIAQSLELEDVLAATADAVFDVLPSATHVGIFLKEDDERFIPYLGRAGRAHPMEPVLSRTLQRRVVADGAGVLASNARSELGPAASIMAAEIQSTLCVPLWRGDEIHGLLQVDNRTSSGVFLDGDLELLTVLAAQVSHAVRHAQVHARLAQAEAAARKENRYLKGKDRREGKGPIIGESAAWEAVMAQVAKVQATRVPVCLIGETGTGKEVVARAVHYGSGRGDGLFVAQNMAALPESILESELFGHIKGAFTGADSDKKGLFEIADGGTIFLDEIGEMPLSLQAKLLRVLQEGEIRPLGATHPRPVDIRVVSATNRNLDAEVEAGNFRQDLYYRLMVYPVRLPPLRERADDIPKLAGHFMQRYSAELGLPARRPLSAAAVAALQAHTWPGNIRELENEAQRLVIQALGEPSPAAEATPADLSPAVRAAAGVAGIGGSAGGVGGVGLNASGLPAEGSGTLKEMMEEVERALLRRTLTTTGGNKTRAAGLLGITREGLHKKLAKLGVT